MTSSAEYQGKINLLVTRKENYLSRIRNIDANISKLHELKSNALKNELKEAEFAAKAIETGAITPEQKAKVDTLPEGI